MSKAPAEKLVAGKIKMARAVERWDAAEGTRARLIADEMCVVCGKQVVERWYCADHAGKTFSPRTMAYAQRKAAGLCVRCSSDVLAVEGQVHCTDCSEEIRKRNKAKYARLKAAKLCVECGRVPVKGQMRCAGHLKRIRLWCKALKKDRKLAKLCVECGKSAEVGRALCVDHRDKRRGGEKKTYAEMKAAGLCVDCGKVPVEGQPRCAKDLKRLLLLANAARKRRKIDKLCVECGKPPAEAGQLLCVEHRERARTLKNKSNAKLRAAKLAKKLGVSADGSGVSGQEGIVVKCVCKRWERMYAGRGGTLFTAKIACRDGGERPWYQGDVGQANAASGQDLKKLRQQVGIFVRNTRFGSESIGPWRCVD